jgi:alkylation response protein AidB-like acyl-CoA dehydrogenase
MELFGLDFLLSKFLLTLSKTVHLVESLVSQTMSESALIVASHLAKEFAQSAVARDVQGKTPKKERDQIRSSGLLGLNIPKQYGGYGENWESVFAVSREFARVDSSIAHVLSYHHLGVVTPHIFGSPEQKERYYLSTIKNNWFWGNAANPLDRRTTLKPDGENFRLDGVKNFCSGSHDSDILPVTAVEQTSRKLMVMIVPTKREGIKLNEDWDNMGQRQTDSGSVVFSDVLIYPQEILGSRESFSSPFSSIRACLTQLNLAHIYLGIAEGAFFAAKDYIHTSTQPWLTSQVSKSTEDPYVLENYGNLWLELQGSNALVQNACILLQSAWDKEWELSEQERGECAVYVATAKVAAHRAGLSVVNQIFEAMGARSTSKQYGFDRYWRNLRTLTLHDPIAYKIKDLGNWALNDQYPQPSFYS